ncbi:MAG: hypothetical protein K8H87_16415 [Pseudorhodoplanes sp.]|nr:hypothetical protein [Pseudorhodoplanes sp.]
MPLYYATVVDSLRAMARCEHDDFSVGTDAADRIERLEHALANILGVMRSGPEGYLNDPMVTAALEIAEQALKDY